MFWYRKLRNFKTLRGYKQQLQKRIRMGSRRRTSRRKRRRNEEEEERKKRKKDKRKSRNHK